MADSHTIPLSCPKILAKLVQGRRCSELKSSFLGSSDPISLGKNHKPNITYGVVDKSFPRCIIRIPGKSCTGWLRNEKKLRAAQVLGSASTQQIQRKGFSHFEAGIMLFPCGCAWANLPLCFGSKLY